MRRLSTGDSHSVRGVPRLSQSAQRMPQRLSSALVPKAGQSGPLDSLDYAKPSTQVSEQEQRWESNFRSGQVRVCFFK